MGYVSKYRGVDIDQAIEFAKEHADIDKKLSEKAEVLHSHKLSDITGLTDLKISWENITGKPETFPCDGSCGGTGNGGSDTGGNGNESGGQVSGTISWGNIIGKPSTFTPSAHTHVITDLSNVGDLKVDWNNIINKPENITGGGNTTPVQITWEIIQNKPTVFTPASHRHHASEIDGLSTGTGGTTGTVTWDNVLEKPDLAAKIHKHSISDVIGLEDRLTYIEENAGSNSGGGSSTNNSELKNKIEIIENDVDNLQSQVEIVQSGFNIVQGSVMSLQSTIGNIQSSNLDLKSDVIENKAEISDLKDSVKSLNDKVNQGNSYESDITSLRQNISDLQVKDANLQSEVESINEVVNTLKEDVEKQGNTITNISEDSKNALNIAEDVRKTVEELEDGLEDQLDIILSGSEFGERLDNAEANIEANSSNIQDIFSSIQDSQNEIERLDQDINSINESLNEAYYIWQGDDETVPDLNNDPAVRWATITDKRAHLGDFFITSEGYCYKFVESGNIFSWIEVHDRYIVPYARKIASKSTIFIQQPSIEDEYKPGDLWLKATYAEAGSTIYSSETLVCIEEKLQGDEFDIRHWESAELANINDVIEVSNSLVKYQRRVILETKEELFKEETWKDSDTGEFWIYNGLVISVIKQQKLYLLVNKERYQYDDAWVEIGKTISLTWDNITDKPDFLETIDSEVTNLRSDLENLSTTVEENNLATSDRIDIIENETIPSLENTISDLDELLSDHYYIWQGDDDIVPDLANDPAVRWTSDSMKKSHVGDFYINSLGYCYKFVQETGNKYKWEQVEDRYVVPYARHIEQKSSIFLKQPEASDLCREGDLWVGATYYEQGSDTPMYKDIVLVCVQEKPEGEEFEISQWEPSSIASLSELGEVSNTIENYRTRVIITMKSQLFQEETWRDNSGKLWIYEGLVISVINEQKLYLLVNKERYQYEDAWVEIGKTLSLTWDNISEKPEYLETIDDRVTSLESEVSNNTSSITAELLGVTERLDTIENESLPELENSIESVNELLSEHYYIWQGEDDVVPDLSNDPAILWTTDTEKKSHIGDFYINSLGYCYKFVQDNNTYKWIEVQDRYIVPYARRIAGKSTIFISKPEDSDLYSPGDIWLNATYVEGDTVLYDRVTLVCINEKEEGEEFSIDDWEEASIVDKELEEVDQKIENYRTRIILKNKSQLYQEETWKDANGELWIYEGLVVSVINDQKLYLLIDVTKYQYEDAWIEIGKTLSLTWDNITDKPELSPSDHIHQDYEDQLTNLESNVLDLQDSATDTREKLEEYDTITLPKIEENLEVINNSLVNQFYIWHGGDNEIPTSQTAPEVNWITINEKKEHVGDFYITLDGQCFKYTQTNTGFEWVLVSDRYIISYAEKINHKSTIFNTVPTIDDEYKPGDIWINATYTDELGNRIFNNDIVLCVVEKEVGDEFNYADWQAVLKADEVNIDNTTITVGANQVITGHKTFAVPVYFGEAGTGPIRDEEAYQPLYSSLYDDGNNNFTLEAGKRFSTGEVKTLNIKNTTAGGIRITTELNDDFKEESAKSGDINISSTKGGNIGIFSNNDVGKVAGKIYIQTKTAKNANKKDDTVGILLNPDTNTASIYNQETTVTNLCDGYAEVSGFKGFAITSKATASRNDMTGVRFKWEKTDADGNEINTLDIHRVSYEEGKIAQNSLSLKINGSAEVLTSANFKTYVDAEGNVIDFNTGYISDPDEMTGAIDVSEKLQNAINDAISNNAKLIIKYGTYLLSKQIVIKSLDESFEYFIIDANNSLFLCDKGIIDNKVNYGGTLPFGGTQDDDLKVGEIESTGTLFVIGSNPTVANEPKMDQGTVDIRNLRVKAANNKRTEWIAFDIQAQKCVHFDNVTIENFHTGFKMNRCTNNPSIKRSSIINTVFGINSIGDVRNLTVEDCIFSKNGTGIYINRTSSNEFACNIVTHSTFDNCYYGIYGHSAYSIKAFRIKCNKFNSNESMDIMLKNTIIYPTISGVTFYDTTRTVTKIDGEGNEYQEEEAVPWDTRSSIPITLPEGYIISSSNALPSELSDVSPEASSIGGVHTATWTKTPPVWGDSNIIITDNIFYDCHGVRIGNGKKGGHVSGVQFSGNKIEGQQENCIKICSELDGNCSAVSVFNNTYLSTKRDAGTGKTISINFEVPAKSSLLGGTDYMPVGGVMSRYQTKPIVPELSSIEEGQVGDLRWDETKAYLKTETGWKAIQFTHTFDNKSTAKAWKPLETGAQQPADINGYTVGDIVWNLDGSSRTLGWRLVKDSQNLVSWQRIEDLIRAYLDG